MNFFSQLATLMDGKYEVRITIQKAGEVMTVELVPERIEEKESGEALIPMVFRGTSAEIDADIIPGIANAMHELCELTISGRSFLGNEVEKGNKAEKPIKEVKTALKGKGKEKSKKEEKAPKKEPETPVEEPETPVAEAEDEEVMAADDTDDLPFKPDEPKAEDGGDETSSVDEDDMNIDEDW